MATNRLIRTPSPTTREIWTRIQAFSFDEAPSAFPFWARLAKDNGWSLAFAARAIGEYRRFAYLAVVAGHPVTPSDQVDQVWHLHLLYTHSYWSAFCRDTLGTVLHHVPTTGGANERNTFHDWYAQTLDSYRRIFGEVPPSDVWPAARVRFGDDVHYRRVNTSRHWVIRKPWTIWTLWRSR
jgi:hypothetical protein